MTDDEKTTKRDVSLSDLNDDPSLLDGLKPKHIKRLQKEAELGEVALAGTVRQQLNTLYNTHFPPEPESSE